MQVICLFFFFSISKNDYLSELFRLEKANLDERTQAINTISRVSGIGYRISYLLFYYDFMLFIIF